MQPTQRHSSRWWRRIAATTLASSLGILSFPLSGVSQTAPNEPPTDLSNTASFGYTAPGGLTIDARTNEIVQPLIDPFGVITGCNGELLPNYNGFNVSVHETDASGLNIGALVPLTQTELPDNPNNAIPRGLAPNGTNANPYFVQNDGRYSFLLDQGRGQLAIGRNYLIIINPPQGSIYAQRRVRITITGQTGNIVSYVATAVDGRPLSSTDGQNAINGDIRIANAEATGLSLAVLNFSIGTCDAQEVKITKSGDRANAEPGDTVIYRLSIRNLSSTTLTNLSVADILPQGFRFVNGSARAEIAGQAVTITTNENGQNITFQTAGASLASGVNNQTQVLNIAYAAQLTPDAIRGTGQNIASVFGQRADNAQRVQDGPATHKMRVRSSLITDCGTIIGRVFHDKNFDGEQQAGEPGIPNAVVILDDGNRITTDKNGLYSVANVLAGQRTAVLDATSVRGYTLAPNKFVRERNSQSRLVNLSPGGLQRMNFAVTPAAKEEQPCNCN
ncbi:DUF11 domain-containing protein [filamentous cyanobacterium LEGE 11480]|uniref:DUF11 domain-containing protein n=1 Tax=Romeriopsis navalis LEGE 11480 TaxID=2777977 RepID=A0A928Z5U2_9CYAN|nr:SdrD B-like domain-containing protein [Romeriopsis navalis]MBE9032342.1 DUF11 domain-containing protein [Romeriopsis navalis LEGE 11480]